MFYCTLLYVHSSIAIILIGKRELVALLGLSSWCLVMVGRLFLAVPRGCLRFVIVVFPDYTIFAPFKCLHYRIFKTSHCFESYLNYLPDDLRITLSKFRCVNNNINRKREN